MEEANDDMIRSLEENVNDDEWPGESTGKQGTSSKREILHWVQISFGKKIPVKPRKWPKN